MINLFTFLFYCEPRTALKKFITHLIGNSICQIAILIQTKKPGSRIHHPLNQYATHYLNSFLFRLIRSGKPTSNLKTKGSILQMKPKAEQIWGKAQPKIIQLIHVIMVCPSKNIFGGFAAIFEKCGILKMLSISVYIHQS